MGAMLQHPIPRKPPRNAQAAANRQNPPSKMRRDLVRRWARDHHATGDTREFSSVASRRLGVPESEIDRILIGEMLASDARADTLHTAIVGALDAERGAAADVWEVG